MMVSKLISQVDSVTKIGSAKVSRKKTRKDYIFSLKLVKSQKGNFEYSPFLYFLIIKRFDNFHIYQYIYNKIP